VYCELRHDKATAIAGNAGQLFIFELNLRDLTGSDRAVSLENLFQVDFDSTASFGFIRA